MTSMTPSPVWNGHQPQVPELHFTPPYQPDTYRQIYLQQLTYYQLYSPHYPRRPGELQTPIDERELRELIRASSPGQTHTAKKPAGRSNTPAPPQGEDSFTKFEMEQRKRPVVETEIPPFNLGAIPSEKAAENGKPSADGAPATDSSTPAANLEGSEPQKTRASESRPTASGAGWSQSSLGVLAVVAVLGALILAVSAWYIGRGVYDRLEYR
jgi:hypothetical protein